MCIGGVRGREERGGDWGRGMDASDVVDSCKNGTGNRFNLHLRTSHEGTAISFHSHEIL
jgi:hypothetical protein